MIFNVPGATAASRSSDANLGSRKEVHEGRTPWYKSPALQKTLFGVGAVCTFAAYRSLPVSAPIPKPPPAPPTTPTCNAQGVGSTNGNPGQNPAQGASGTAFFTDPPRTWTILNPNKSADLAPSPEDILDLLRKQEASDSWYTELNRLFFSKPSEGANDSSGDGVVRSQGRKKRTISDLKGRCALSFPRENPFLIQAKLKHYPTSTRGKEPLPETQPPVGLAPSVDPNSARLQPSPKDSWNDETADLKQVCLHKSWADYFFRTNPDLLAECRNAWYVCRNNRPMVAQKCYDIAKSCLKRLASTCDGVILGTHTMATAAFHVAYESPSLENWKQLAAHIQGVVLSNSERELSNFWRYWLAVAFRNSGNLDEAWNVLNRTDPTRNHILPEWVFYREMAEHSLARGNGPAFCRCNQLALEILKNTPARRLLENRGAVLCPDGTLSLACDGQATERQIESELFEHQCLQHANFSLSPDFCVRKKPQPDPTQDAMDRIFLALVVTVFAGVVMQIANTLNAFRPHHLFFRK